jgi:signal peptidase I
MKAILNFLLIILIAAVVFVGLELSIKTFEVFDISMQPNYKEGDYILVNRLAYLLDSPKRGDVIALYTSGTVCPSLVDSVMMQDSTQYIKRIIALPGDTIEVSDSKVIINGEPISETYIKEPCDYTLTKETIPAGQYFVLGDNRNNSYDSHRGWLVTKDDIVGQVCVCYWNAKYPDIHVAVVPFFLVIVGIFSIDVIYTVAKGKKS